jgi:hypothetical protein
VATGNTQKTTNTSLQMVDNFLIIPYNFSINLAH